MGMRRALMLLKRSAVDIYTNLHKDPSFSSLVRSNHPVVGNILDRHKRHEAAVNFCRNVLRQQSLDFREVYRDELIAPISDVDLVITVGGDGTLLQASHFMDNTIPVLGVNSDPTDISEIEEKLNEFYASRSTGYLCAATVENFEQVIDEIVEGKKKPSNVTRMLTCIDGIYSRTMALNDILIAHPNPAAVSRFSFKITKEHEDCYFPLVHSRSSGMRICTAAGSTAAMKSAGGYPMPILTGDLQYMVREPIFLDNKKQEFMHGGVKPGEILDVCWGSRRGFVYFDGSHVYLPISCGSTIQISSKGTPLQIFLQTDKY